MGQVRQVCLQAPPLQLLGRSAAANRVWRPPASHGGVARGRKLPRSARDAALHSKVGLGDGLKAPGPPGVCGARDHVAVLGLRGALQPAWLCNGLPARCCQAGLLPALHLHRQAPEPAGAAEDRSRHQELAGGGGGGGGQSSSPLTRPNPL